MQQFENKKMTWLNCCNPNEKESETSIMSAFKEQLKKGAQEEREKLRGMSLKDKIWYIWEYYKIPIVGTIILVSIIVSVASAMYSNRFDTALYMVIINNHTSDNGKQEEVVSELKDYLNLTDVREIVCDSSMYISFDSSGGQMDYATMAKISALVAAQELDVMISDSAVIDNYGRLNGLSNLEELLPADLYETLQERIYYTTDESGNEIPTAISLADTKFASDMNLTIEDPLLSVLSNTEHTDNCIALLHYIFD